MYNAHDGIFLQARMLKDCNRSLPTQYILLFGKLFLASTHL